MTHPARKLLAKKRPKPIRCKAPGCQDTFTRVRDGQEVCGYQCGLNLTRYRDARKLKRQRLLATRELRARREAAKTPSQLWNAECQRAQKAVCAYVRVRDRMEPCLSCGASIQEVESGPWRPGGYWDGAHFLSKAAMPSIRFNTWNIHKTCKICNGGENRYRHAGKANSVKAGYRAGLIRKIGLERVEWLEGPHPILQPDIEYLERIKTIFTRRTKHLKKIRGYHQ